MKKDGLYGIDLTLFGNRHVGTALEPIERKEMVTNEYSGQFCFHILNTLRALVRRAVLAHVKDGVNSYAPIFQTQKAGLCVHRHPLRGK